MKSEAYEEGYITGNCFPLGFMEVDHNENPNWDNSGPYPLVGYQVFFVWILTNYTFFMRGTNRKKENLSIQKNLRNIILVGINCTRKFLTLVQAKHNRTLHRLSRL
ncbi:hypothetical protein ACTWP7_07550 [Halobacillus sp. B29]